MKKKLYKGYKPRYWMKLSARECRMIRVNRVQIAIQRRRAAEIRKTLAYQILNSPTSKHRITDLLTSLGLNTTLVNESIASFEKFSSEETKKRGN